MSKRTEYEAADALRGFRARECVEPRKVITAITAHVLDEIAAAKRKPGMAWSPPPEPATEVVYDTFGNPVARSFGRRPFDPVVLKAIEQFELPDVPRFDLKPFVADAAPERPYYSDGLEGGDWISRGKPDREDDDEPAPQK